LNTFYGKKNIMPLKDSIAILAATPPPPAQERKQALADANAKIAVLESQLGIKARLMPIFNPTRAAARLADLEKQLAAKSAAPAPAAALTAPVARPAELTGSPLLDKAIVDGGFRSQRQRNAALRLDQLIDMASGLPAGPTRLCVESKISAAKANLERCS
jgi:hypothetical protein